jgi:phosphoribosylaminoimidazolecarboxamide formyltransferase / IMP cyclohydrolase
LSADLEKNKVMPLALLSVSNKTGIVEFARQLVDTFKFDIISSGGTAQTLKDAGVPVTKVAEYTGAPEILGGRVKTLHPKIHGGILARKDLPEHLADLAAQDIRAIDLVVVNLYPFTETIAKENVTLAEAIEQIDIGGPAMIRAAAKNFAHLTVLTNPAQYSNYLAEIAASGLASDAFRQARALDAFAHTAAYDRAITDYLSNQSESPAFPANYLPPSGEQQQSLRYGENPHQPAAWYRTGSKLTGWAAAVQLQGKELSYNNLVDLEAARQIIVEFPHQPAATIIKHNNPCGTALGHNLLDAYEKAYQADSTSAFGGIVALSQPIDAATATAMSKTFLECIVAPDCTPEAQQILATKKNLRVLTLADFNTSVPPQLKSIAGGYLLQAPNDGVESTTTWQIVTEKQPTAEQLAEMLFAWKVCKHVKSNAIVVSKNNQTIGVGAGQMNRVGSAQIALAQAGENARGATLASDGFFPFDDSVRSAAAAGITMIVQPGGSKLDADSILAANELGIVMVFTGTRHFLH